MTRWFRHYTGMMRDEKLVAVAVKSKQSVERVLWVWSAILESASEISDGGRFDLDAAEAAYFLRTDESDICSIMDALSSAGRISSGVVVKWSDRQYESDKSANRQARYRERKRQETAGIGENVTLSDVTVTSRDGVVTPPDTDTDTDTERSKKKESADAFAFVGKVIRLKHADYDRWKTSYPNITDLKAELTLADDYYSQNQPKDGKWFFQVSQWLKKANQQALDKKGDMKFADKHGNLPGDPYYGVDY
jgi:hypothetical protein